MADTNPRLRCRSVFLPLARLAHPWSSAREGRLQLPRRPEQRCEDHRGQTDHEADDPTGDVLADEHGAQEHGDADDPAGGDQPHRGALELGAAPLSAGQHPPLPLTPPSFALPVASLA